MERFKIRVLVIEDDGEMRSLMKDFFEAEGYEVVSVENGAEAFSKLANKPFDLIITDVRMPGVSGMDILPGLKRIQPNSTVIVTTAFGSEEVRRRALARGADSFLEKPIHLTELRRLIQKIFFDGKRQQMDEPMPR
jgi:DNA-binding response OmpR family regulator